MNRAGRPVFLVALALLMLLSCLDGHAQPGPLDTLVFYLPAGTLASPSYSPVAMSFYPYHNGMPNDSIQWVFGDQLVSGTPDNADRVIDIRTGSYAYRTGPGQWAGSMALVRNRRALFVVNRHDANFIYLTGFPADSMTYVFPMAAGTVTAAAPRMGGVHAIDQVGFINSSFHGSETMRMGGDLLIDMATRQIARYDQFSGWIGTLDSLRPGNPVIIQVNNLNTFDWIYYPGQP